MALFYGCMENCCRNMLDTTGIVIALGKLGRGGEQPTKLRI
jgi:hypothetical protein